MNISKKYKLSGARFMELYYWTLQYNEWLEQLAEIQFISGVKYNPAPGGSGTSDTVATTAEKRELLLKNIGIVHAAAREAGGDDMYQALLKGVTTPKSSYVYLRSHGIATCGERQYYEARRKFYWLVDKKKK